MDDAVVTRLYGYHGNRSEDVYNATRFAERRYAVTGVDGYNRMLAGALERVDNDFPRPYGPSADDWVDERDKASEERRAGDDCRNAFSFAGGAASSAIEERRLASGVVEPQAWHTCVTGARDTPAAGAMRRGVRSSVVPGATSGPIVGHTLVSPSVSWRIGNIRLVAPPSASTVVMRWNPDAARRAASDIASDAVANHLSDDANGKPEKDGTSRKEQSRRRDTGSRAARIKADILQHVDAELKRRFAQRD